MKVSKRSLLIGAVALLAVLALIATASAGAPAMREAGKGPPSSSALEKIDTFRQTLGDAGFSLEQGEFSFWDLVKLTCQGVMPDALANNPWPNAYIIAKFPSDSGAGVSGLLDATWQITDDEAIVLVGQTPPSSAYYSYSTYAATLPDDPTTPNIDESLRRMGSPVGDTINIGTIKTIGPDKFNRPIVYIVTGSRETERRVRAAALQAGYPNAIINVETISPVIAPLGRGKAGSTFALTHRVAVPQAKEEVEDYIRNSNNLYKVFRLTPTAPLPADPEPVPVLRVRGTGHTEMELYPAVKKLRLAILDTYKSKGFGETLRKDLDTKVWQLPTPPEDRDMITEKPYVGLQRGYQVIGATRDTNYLATYPNFMLREGENEFVIVYGVNHQKTGKATYSSFSIYADKDHWFGLVNGTTLSPNFDQGGEPGASARQYLGHDPDPKVDKLYDNLYAWKVARHCNGEAFCMEVKVNDDPELPFAGMDGVPYACYLWDVYSNPGHPIQGPKFYLDNAQMFFLWRSYMEPATLVGPDDNELVYDRAIYFGPYFEEQ